MCRREKHDSQRERQFITDNLLPQKKTKFSTHLVRDVDVRAGCQQDLRHLCMPRGRRPVKWGVIVLRKGSCDKDDSHSETTQGDTRFNV
jgi:hypothetical protein